MILQCASPDCRKWQHVKCIAETAVHHAGKTHMDLKRIIGTDCWVADEAAGTKKPTPKKARPKDVSISKNSPALAKAETDSFIVEVFIKGMPSGANHTPSEKSEIVITTKGQDEKQSQDVGCLFCGTQIE